MSQNISSAPQARFFFSFQGQFPLRNRYFMVQKVHFFRACGGPQLTFGKFPGILWSSSPKIRGGTDRRGADTLTVMDEITRRVELSHHELKSRKTSSYPIRRVISSFNSRRDQKQSLHITYFIFSISMATSYKINSETP